MKKNYFCLLPGLCCAFLEQLCSQISLFQLLLLYLLLLYAQKKPSHGEEFRVQTSEIQLLLKNKARIYILNF